MKKLFVLLILTAASCSLSFSQSKITQTRDVSGFTFVHLQIPATVLVTQNEHFSFQISASQELLDKISTDVEDNTLSITLDDKSGKKNFDREDVIINISMPKPNGLQVMGSGTIKAQNNFTTDYLNIEVHGSGEIVMKDFKSMKGEAVVRGSGSIELANCVAEGWVEELDGSGSINTTSLMCTMISMDLSGSGEMKTTQLQCEKLQASQQGSGIITLKNGTAGSILYDNDGSGEIIASGVTGETVSAKVEGSGTISLGVMRSLSANVAGSGSIMYNGSPESISKSVNGSGSVSKI